MLSNWNEQVHFFRCSSKERPRVQIVLGASKSHKEELERCIMPILAQAAAPARAAAAHWRARRIGRCGNLRRRWSREGIPTRGTRWWHAYARADLGLAAPARQVRAHSVCLQYYLCRHFGCPRGHQCSKLSTAYITRRPLLRFSARASANLRLITRP